MSSPQPPDRVPAPVRIRRARSRWPLLVVGAGLAITAAAVILLVRQPVQFSADMVSSTSESYAGTAVQSTTTGTYYAKGPHLSRSEFVEGPRRWVTIHHGDRFWHLDPATRTYYLMFDFTPEQKAKLEAASSRLDRKRLKEFGDRTLVGTEVVNGYLCERHVVKLAGMTGTSWAAPKLNHFPVRVETTMRSQLAGVAYAGTSRQEYRNIKERRLPSSLFEIPEGYREVPPPPPKYRLRKQPAEP